MRVYMTDGTHLMELQNVPQ